MASSQCFSVVEATIAIHAAYCDGSLTARQLVQAYLDRVAHMTRKLPLYRSCSLSDEP
jgi:amidase